VLLLLLLWWLMLLWLLLLLKAVVDVFGGYAAMDSDSGNSGDEEATSGAGQKSTRWFC
jgi:TM2 domain-containing membrane protein YozV